MEKQPEQERGVYVEHSAVQPPGNFSTCPHGRFAGKRPGTGAQDRPARAVKSIQQAYGNVVSSKEKYALGTVSEEASRELLNELREKYELGRASGYEYNEARTKWLKADLKRIQARYELELNLYILKRYLAGAYR